jgi:ubiquitin-protein ligase
VFIPFFDKDKYIDIQPIDGRSDWLQVTIKGLEGTPYEEGKFIFELKLPSNYPYSPPFCRCQTRIWHPNIDPSAPAGKSNVCLDLINPSVIGKVDAQTGASGWTPSKTITNVIEALKGMIHMQPPFWNPNSAINTDAGEIALDNPDAFNEISKDWTRKYAIL